MSTVVMQEDRWKQWDGKLWKQNEFGEWEATEEYRRLFTTGRHLAARVGASRVVQGLRHLIRKVKIADALLDFEACLYAMRYNHEELDLEELYRTFDQCKAKISSL